MIEVIYGVRLKGTSGKNRIFFNSISERMTFLNMLNFGEFDGEITLIEKPRRKQEESNNDKQQ